MMSQFINYQYGRVWVASYRATGAAVTTFDDVCRAVRKCRRARLAACIDTEEERQIAEMMSDLSAGGGQ